jgi:CDP-4-dehydro-6-deoxyglucose reductase, E1
VSDALAALRREILEKVAEFQRLRDTETPAFDPQHSRIPYAGRVYNEDELVSGVDAVLDYWLTAGRFSEALTRDLANWLGIRHLHLVNSGSSANLIAVSALCSPKLKERALKPGDEVITVAAAFPTTVAPIVQNRLVPVFVDVALGSYNALPDIVAAAIGERTRAVVLAHTLGNPWHVDEILAIARRHGLWVVEDNCDALGSLWEGQKTGTFGDIGTLSFYPAHHMTTGEGGAVVTNDDLLGRILFSFRDWGRDCFCKGGESNTCGARFERRFGTLPEGYDHKYVYSHIGYNLKMTDIQAAIGCAQFKKLDCFVAARKENFKFIYDQLRPFEDLLILPRKEASADPAWFAFPITVRPGGPLSRQRVVDYLEQHRIETRPLFSGNLLRHPAFEKIAYRTVAGLKNTERITSDTFFIGVYPGYGDRERAYIAEVLSKLTACC